MNKHLQARTLEDMADLLIVMQLQFKFELSLTKSKPKFPTNKIAFSLTPVILNEWQCCRTLIKLLIVMQPQF